MLWQLTAARKLKVWPERQREGTMHSPSKIKLPRFSIPEDNLPTLPHYCLVDIPANNLPVRLNNNWEGEIFLRIKITCEVKQQLRRWDFFTNKNNKQTSNETHRTNNPLLAQTAYDGLLVCGWSWERLTKFYEVEQRRRKVRIIHEQNWLQLSKLSALTLNKLSLLLSSTGRANIDVVDWWDGRDDI
jgi:hypothetical protein